MYYISQEMQMVDLPEGRAVSDKRHCSNEAMVCMCTVIQCFFFSFPHFFIEQRLV